MTVTVAQDFIGYENTPEPEFSSRRKERLRVQYFEGGSVRSVYLNEPTVIKTLYGDITAELVTFYESGALKRLFPRYGAISAFWTEQNEAELTDYTDLVVGGKTYHCRPHNLHFNEDGSLQSITIYNCDSMLIDTDYGQIKTSIGVSFYKDGKIASIEPAFNTEIILDGKKIRPFYFMADGMHADNNSLVFDEEGKIISYK